MNKIIIMLTILTLLALTSCDNPYQYDDSESYTIGMARGCDLGCIDADLRLNNKSWNDTSYSVLNSSFYYSCSNVCEERYQEMIELHNLELS